MKLEDIVLSPEEIKKTIDETFGSKGFIDKAIANQATLKALKKITNSIDFLEYIDTQLLETPDGDRAYRNQMQFALKELDKGIESIIKELGDKIK